MVVEEWAELTSMAIAISIRPSYYIKEEDERKTVSKVSEEMGQVLSLMGQAHIRGKKNKVSHEGNL